MGLYLDKKGRVTLPKNIREVTGLKPGIEVEVGIKGKAVLLKPKTQQINKVRSNRFWDEKTFLNAGETTFGS